MQVNTVLTFPNLTAAYNCVVSVSTLPMQVNTVLSTTMMRTWCRANGTTLFIAPSSDLYIRDQRQGFRAEVMCTLKQSTIRDLSHMLPLPYSLQRVSLAAGATTGRTLSAGRVTLVARQRPRLASPRRPYLSRIWAGLAVHQLLRNRQSQLPRDYARSVSNVQERRCHPTQRRLHFFRDKVHQFFSSARPSDISIPGTSPCPVCAAGLLHTMCDWTLVPWTVHTAPDRVFFRSSEVFHRNGVPMTASSTLSMGAEYSLVGVSYHLALGGSQRNHFVTQLRVRGSHPAPYHSPSGRPSIQPHIDETSPSGRTNQQWSQQSPPHSPSGRTTPPGGTRHLSGRASTDHVFTSFRDMCISPSGDISPSDDMFASPLTDFCISHSGRTV
ncbi:unnamed protein product [Ectocarpus sp. 12 AP-2014]